MSSFWRRLFSRSRVDEPRSRTGVSLPAAPDPDDLFDWSPRARPEAERPEPVAIEQAPVGEEIPPGDGATVAPISEALSQFQRPGPEPAFRRPTTVSEGQSAGAPLPPPPPPPTKPAQIRLLMGDGTVIVLAGDPELERRIGYLAENLLAPPVEAAELVAEPAPAAAEIVPAQTEAQPEPKPDPSAFSPGMPDPQQTVMASDLSRPHMRLVFTDGTEAALPPDQEIVDRLAYVVKNLLPARPTA